MALELSQLGFEGPSGQSAPPLLLCRTGQVRVQKGENGMLGTFLRLIHLDEELETGPSLLLGSNFIFPFLSPVTDSIKNDLEEMSSPLSWFSCDRT